MRACFMKNEKRNFNRPQEGCVVLYAGRPEAARVSSLVSFRSGRGRGRPRRQEARPCAGSDRHPARNRARSRSRRDLEAGYVGLELAQDSGVSGELPGPGSGRSLEHIHNVATGQKTLIEMWPSVMTSGHEFELDAAL